METVQKGGRLVSPRTGILQMICAGVHQPGDPHCESFAAVASDAARFSTATNASKTSKSGGAGLTMDAALAATIGEAVERYCMNFYDKRDLVLDCARNLNDLAVNPTLVSLLSREQIERNPTDWAFFDEDSVIRWAWGYSLTQDRWRLVPACQVYLNYTFDADEAAIMSNASSGLAAGNTLEEAILSGVYEVIERDAFTNAWLHRYVARRVRANSPRLEEFLATCCLAEHPSINISLFDITLDIPVFCSFAVIQRPAEFGPVLLVGTAARLDPERAIEKSLLEACQEMAYVRYLRNEMQDWYPSEDFTNVTTFDEHFMVYNHRPELIEEAFAFCREVPGVVCSSDLPSRSTGRVLGDVNRAVKFLDERGYEVIVVDITTPDIQDIGLHVVRVLVPGLVPLHGDHNLPFLGVPRLDALRGSLAGGQPGRTGSHGYNPYPHPFP
ncbi:YcaO-like family protein [Polyangium jinanense]|uniref:YcaO-like family protein n=1 Tax=Polyangium jinanense TaxID=2829994 RepID=A0A9X3X535_9BACT|nr:YcaO-like family protein [Polyangium jinanense]MDC3956069.1 YcaO-like family protein [Polyangium jinanense]MDC3982900.1 YcaO-like family protein [Polyangium jinanense]